MKAENSIKAFIHPGRRASWSRSQLAIMTGRMRETAALRKPPGWRATGRRSEDDRTADARSDGAAMPARPSASQPTAFTRVDGEDRSRKGTDVGYDRRPEHAPGSERRRTTQRPGLAPRAHGIDDAARA